MKEKIFICFVLLHITLICSQLEYNGTIEIYIRPNRSELEKKFEQLSPNSLLPSSSGAPVSYEQNLLPHEGQGLDLFDKPNQSSNAEKKIEIANSLLQKSISGIPGCVALYRGYASISDKEGHISFPRMESKDKLTLIICRMIHPVISKGHLPSYFVATEKSTWYEYQTTPNSSSLTVSWKLEKIIPPTNFKLPNNSIVLFANPNDISFEKNTLTVPFSQNILLPTIFYKSKKAMHRYSLEILDILNFYKTLGFDIKQASIDQSIHLAKKIINPLMTISDSLL